MKKQPTKKLALATHTIAPLTRRLLEEAGGAALPNPYTKASACVYQCCVSDWCW